MVWTFVVISILIFIFNFLGAFPLNKKSYLNKEKKKKIQFKKISLPWVTSMPLKQCVPNPIFIQNSNFFTCFLDTRSNTSCASAAALTHAPDSVHTPPS